MKVTDVRAVIAIGLRGQFGLGGRLPWEGYRGRDYLADVERFFELTRGHVLVMGHRTSPLCRILLSSTARSWRFMRPMAG